MTLHSPDDEFDRERFTELWWRAQKRHLKMLAVDLKRRLNSRIDAITKKVAEASSTLLEVTAVSSPPGSVMHRVIGGDLW
jgi:microcystin degradation protein MlrC